MQEGDNRKAEKVRRASIVLEPAIPVTNSVLEMVRGVRKRLGREVRAVWMPPQSYCVRLVDAELPPRALDEVIGMGLSSDFTGMDSLNLRLDPVTLERLNDGSMLVLSRVWSDDPALEALIRTTIGALEKVGVEPVSDLNAGLSLIMGWIPGPCDLSSIPADETACGSISVNGVVAGILEPVASTPMYTCRRVRTVCFDMRGRHSSSALSSERAKQ